MSGSGIEIKFSEDWFMKFARGKSIGKKRLKEALRRGMETAGKAMQADFVSKLHSGKLKKRTGQLEKSFLKPGSLKIEAKSGSYQIIFGSDDPAAWALEKGATVTPKRGKWLAWPLIKFKTLKEYQGKRPAKRFFDRHGRNALFVPPKTIKGLSAGIYLKTGKGRLQKHFKVARQTKVPRRLLFERRTQSFWDREGAEIVMASMKSKLGL
tara:strand:- start:269 stop:898 length:630 start_codon:yes stop_codon:yes gene_type:complete